MSHVVHKKNFAFLAGLYYNYIDVRLLGRGKKAMLQLIIVTVLAFVLIFGLGFIFNMLLKTTWFPIYAYTVLVVGLMVYAASQKPGSLWGNLAVYTLTDYTTITAGLLGAVMSGLALRKLRVLGYKMF